MTEIEYPVSCPFCNRQLFGPVLFCPFCGKEIKASSQQDEPEVITENIDNASELEPEIDEPVLEPVEEEPVKKEPEARESEQKAKSEEQPEKKSIAPEQKTKKEETVRDVKQTKPPSHLMRNFIIVILIIAGLIVLFRSIGSEKKSEISVLTEPSGATLMVDNENKGSTPAQGISVEPGNHHIIIEKDGYQKYEQDVLVEAGDKKDLSINLSPEVKKPAKVSAELNISTTPDGALVKIDGVVKGNSPIHLENLTPGKHSLTIIKVGYEIKHVKVNLKGGEKKAVEYELKLPTEEASKTVEPNSITSTSENESGTRPYNETIKENKVLPDEPKLNNYDVALQPASTLKQGSTAKLVSTIDISPWKNNKKAAVKEEVLLTLPDGTQKQWISPYPGLAEGGQFAFSMDIKTQDLPVGAYTYKTKLFINDNPVANREFSFKIVSNGDLLFEDDLKEIESLINKSRYKEAITLCESILRKDPSNSNATQYLQKAKEEQSKALDDAFGSGGAIKKTN